MSSELACEVARALQTRGWTLDPNRQTRLARRGFLIGKRLYERFKADLSDEFDPAGTVRALGSGYVLTEFAAAPVPLAADKRDPVLTLGALANLIVTSFDELVDSGQPPHDVLARAALQDRRRDSGGTPIYRLVARYYRELAVLTVDSPHVRALLEIAIRRMYDAEVQAATGGRRLSTTAWRRKSALPFVVMGFAGWGRVCSDGTARAGAHLRWLYRLGTFFGLIDDCVDLDADRTAGRPNYIAQMLAERNVRSAAAHVAATGVRTLTDWEALVQADTGTEVARQTFVAAVSSWLNTAPRSN